MNEELISFKTAKLSKEKGFALFTNVRYSDKNIGNSLLKRGQLSTLAGASLSAPTQSLLQKWLRENHGISLYVDWGTVLGVIKWRFELSNINTNSIYTKTKYFNTYEQAMESGLLEALKLIK